MTQNTDRDTLNGAIGARILGARAERRLNRKQLAALAGLTEPVLGCIERGETAIRVGDLYAIASALNKPMWYFTGEGTPPESPLSHLPSSASLSEVALFLLSMARKT